MRRNQNLIPQLLFATLLVAGCSSSSDTPPDLLDDETQTPPATPGGEDMPPVVEPPVVVVPPAEGVNGKINSDNYAELVRVIEEVGFRTFTGEYFFELSPLTQPFTLYTNELFDPITGTDIITLDDTRDCEVSGTTKSSGDIFFGTLDYSIQYDFAECMTQDGTVNGTYSTTAFRFNIAETNDVYNLEFTNVDMGGVRVDRVVKGTFNLVDNQGLNLETTFDVTSYAVIQPDGSSVEVSGTGSYSADTSVSEQDLTGATAETILTATLVLLSIDEDGSELSVDVKSTLGLGTTSDFEVGAPAAGTLELSADDGSMVVISPADTVGMVNVDLTAADGAVSQDIRSWADILSRPLI